MTYIKTQTYHDSCVHLQIEITEAMPLPNVLTQILPHSEGDRVTKHLNITYFINQLYIISDAFEV